ncbi:MAG: extracellular solute-binding protein, partial [Clostridia bacterium]|nr:extracellular solute-binding protein [Clostridia bacterium]
MKKTIITSLLIITLLLLFGCDKAEEISKPSIVSTPMTSDEENHEIDDPSDITSISALQNDTNDDVINIYIGAPKEPNRMTEVEVEQWKEFIFNQFNYKVNLIFYDESDKNIDNYFKQTDFNGIVYMDYNDDFGSFVDANCFLPLDDYLKNINFNGQDYDAGLSLMQNQNGFIYGIPVAVYSSYDYRNYNYEVLQELNFKVPETIDEFTEFARVAKAKDIYVSFIKSSFRNYDEEFLDVYRAFGCYFNPERQAAIGFNPYSKQFENTLLTENFKRASEYIRWLKDSDYIFTYSDSKELSDITFATFGRY